MNDPNPFVKKRPASCHDCGSKETYFPFPYSMRWYRRWRREVCIRCKDCKRHWYVMYP